MNFWTFLDRNIGAFLFTLVMFAIFGSLAFMAYTDTLKHGTCTEARPT